MATPFWSNEPTILFNKNSTLNSLVELAISSYLDIFPYQKNDNDSIQYFIPGYERT